MADERQIGSGELADIVGKRRDLPVYERNPSVTKVGAIPMRRKQIVMAEGERTLIIGKGTGEVLGEGNALYMENRMVNRERLSRSNPPARPTPESARTSRLSRVLETSSAISVPCI